MGNHISRREAMKRFAAGTAGATLAGRLSEAGAGSDRPNIVFVITDDQRWDAMSNMPNDFPYLETPHMDRLAREGARMENAFVTTSLCSPSRANFLTGRYAHSNGVKVNSKNDPLPGIPTYPEILQQAGYRTAFIGKWHMRPDASPRPGYDYWLSFSGQGQYFDCPLNENGRSFQSEGYLTDVLTDYAVDWLGRQDGEQPFCMILSHKAVHGPFKPAPRHRDAWPDARIPKPESWADDLSDKPDWMRRAMEYGARREAWQESEGKPIPDSIDVGEWGGGGSRLDQLRCLLAVDEGLGRVLGTLEDMGQLDDTVFVFTSDNGYFFGEHHRGDKRLAYEPSIRIPMLVRYPKLIEPGSRPEGMVLNIDTAPTLLDLAGAPIPDGVQGRSFRPLLEGEDADWRNDWLYEYFQEGWLPGIPTMLGVRTERWKYITYPETDYVDELYDLENDPHEMDNLAVDGKYEDRVDAMRDRLERLKEETDYGEAPEVTLPKEAAEPTPALQFTFENDTDGTAVDTSGNGNDGDIHGTELVDGPRDRARRFTGNDYIEVGTSKSLDPTRKPITVSARLKAEGAGGMVLARGGKSHGFALYLEDGKPAFAVRSSGNLHVVRGPKNVTGRWVEVTGMLNRHLDLVLFVDGKKVAQRADAFYVVTDPNDILQVGQDRASNVGDYDGNYGFRGLIEEVSVHWGHAKP